MDNNQKPLRRRKRTNNRIDISEKDRWHYSQYIIRFREGLPITEEMRAAKNLYNKLQRCLSKE